MKKKLLAVGLSLMLSAGMLAGCGKDNADNQNKNSDVTPTQAQETEEGDISYKISDKVIADSYPAIATEGVDITDEMCEDAIVHEGNMQRLAKVMEKASNGEDITIAYLGGSITNGSSASPQAQKCYAGLTQVWWQYTFQDCNINYVNAGVGATDSYIGVHRAAKDVLASKPDLVVVEYSVNDTNSNNQETYESLLREILNSETQPAVVSLVICTENYFYKDHYQVAINLDIPCISYAKVALSNMSDGTWTWDQLGSTDGTHPKNGGHSVIAHLLTYYYNKVLNSINDTKYTEYTVTDETITLSRYENADIFFSDEIEADSMEGFEKSVISNSNLFNKNGWATENGGSITFTVKASNAGLIFWKTTDGKSGKYDIYVNDEYTTTLDADFSGGWGNYADYVEIGKYGEESELKITIQPAEGYENSKLSILALTVS